MNTVAWYTLTFVALGSAVLATIAAVWVGGDADLFSFLVGLAVGTIGVALAALSFGSDSRTRRQLDRIEAALKR